MPLVNIANIRLIPITHIYISFNANNRNCELQINFNNCECLIIIREINYARFLSWKAARHTEITFMDF